MHHSNQRKIEDHNLSDKINLVYTNITNILKFQTIDSTHLHAIRLAEKEKVEECIIISEEQTGGIGRCGRKWISSSGNLFISILKKTNEDFFKDPNELGRLSLTIACAVKETIAYYISDAKNLCLHWPNDIYYKNEKISGILISTINDYLIISIGININSAPHLESRKTISIKEILQNSEMIDVSRILNILLKNIDNWVQSFKMKGFSYIKSYWLLNINKINCKIIVKNGSSSISGTFVDIDEYGRLVLEKCGERLFISSGDLFMNQEGIIVKHD